jgi:hypothetical protein
MGDGVGVPAYINSPKFVSIRKVELIHCSVGTEFILKSLKFY